MSDDDNRSEDTAETTGESAGAAVQPDGTTSGLDSIRVDLAREFDEAGIGEVLDELDRKLIGLEPVKRRVREIAALLLVEQVRTRVGLSAEPPSLHMSFTGNPGTGKTTVAMEMAKILHRLGYVRKGHVIAVTRDDLVGQYIGHTAPKTKEVLKKAMGGVLFIDEAYYLYRPENEKDYGQEAIEILLQVMENQREDLVVILAGYKDRMSQFFASNPGMASRIAHHVEFPDYTDDELLAIAEKMLARMELPLRRGVAAGVRRVHPAQASAAALRQRALGAKRARQDADAPGAAAVRVARRRAHRRRPDGDPRPRDPREPHLRRRRRGRRRSARVRVR